MTRVLKHLQANGRTLFEALFAPEASRSTLVVTFLALLELVRERLVDVVQNEPFAPIYADIARAVVEPLMDTPTDPDLESADA
jgi:segregation and condensation protein A